MDKEEIRKGLLELIDGYEKLIDDNLEKMANLQTRIVGLRDLNDKFEIKIREIRRKVSSLDE